MASRPPKPLSEEVASGFDATRALLFELFAVDRQDAAQLASLLVRLEYQGKALERLESDLVASRLVLDALRSRPSGPPEAVQIEGIKGKWTAIGIGITAASGAIMGLISLLK